MSTQSNTTPKPGLAIVAPTQERYRHALHRRIVAEIPEFKLHSIYTHTQGVANRAQRDESDVNAVFFDTGEATPDRNKPANQLNNIRRANRILGYFKENNVKAAILLGYNDICMLSLFRKCKRAGIKTYLWSDSNVKADTATGIKRAIKRRIIRYVDRLSSGMFVCGSLGRDFFKSYGVDESRIIYSPYEPDYSLIKDLPDEAIERTREHYKIDKGRKRFVFCGRLVQAKRPDLAIRSFLDVANERPDWDLILIGGGDALEDLKTMVPDDLAHRILFTGFIDDQQAISSLYRLSDVLVHPCEIEPWGLIINEAAAAGLAIITTKACGAGPELVEDGRNGFLIEPGTSEELTQAMLRTTEPGAADTFKRESAGVLTRWSQQADPVMGIRKALVRDGLIPETEYTPA